jgi:hypothetical protein
VHLAAGFSGGAEGGEGAPGEAEDDPGGNGEEKDCEEALPGPLEEIGLNGKESDGEIAAEAGATKKRAIAGKAAAQSTVKGEQTDDNGNDRDDDIHGEERAHIEPSARAGGARILPGPLRAGPKQVEAGLDRGLEGGFFSAEFCHHPTEVERHDTPDQWPVFKWLPDQFGEDGKVVGVHRGHSFLYEPAIARSTGRHVSAEVEESG